MYNPTNAALAGSDKCSGATALSDLSQAFTCVFLRKGSDALSKLLILLAQPTALCRSFTSPELPWGTYRDLSEYCGRATASS